MKSDSLRKFAAFDIDGTLFRSGLYLELVFELIELGVLPEEIAIEANEKMRNWKHRLHGNAFEEFDMTLVSYLDSRITTLKISDYETAALRVIESKADNVFVYTRDLLKRLKQEGYFLIAISGSQEELVEPFAKKYGFDTWVGQKWERGSEYFTGNITKTHTGKDSILKRLIEEHNLTLQDSWAVGDSNGDVGMLSMVEHPIAFCPTKELYEKAQVAGWPIVFERKNTIATLEKQHGSYVLV